jgi:hypothetical protein
MDIYAHVLPKLQQQAATEMDAVFDGARKAQREREKKEELSRGAATGENGAAADAPKAVVN